METDNPNLSDKEKARAELLKSFSSEVIVKGKTDKEAAKLRKDQQDLIIKSRKNNPKFNNSSSSSSSGRAGELDGMGQVAINTRGQRPETAEQRVDGLERDDKGWYRWDRGLKVYEK